MTEEVAKYVGWLLVHYDHSKQCAYSELISVWPRFDNYNQFEKFTILNLLVIGIYLLLTTIAKFSIKGIYEKIMKLIFDLPPIKNFILKELDKASKEVLTEHPAHLMVTTDKVPYKPPSTDFGEASEIESLKGKTSGSRYALEHHAKFIKNMSKLFGYTNPLHTDTFPLVKQMEMEVIAMVADFIGLKDEEGRACGTINSGGSESIIMAIYAYREYSMRERGAYKPNLVVCQHGHASALKACNYFDIEARIIPFDKNYQMDLRKMKNAIDENTICVYASYPNHPIGTADQVDIIGLYCKKRNIPVHADMCLGGFVLPFQEKDWKLPEGVTSVSADPHKYGLSAKGVSVLLFSSQKYRKYQYFITQYWPGGLYGTPGLAGSRSGVPIASAWISLMKLGRKGLQQNAKLLKDTLVKMRRELTKIGFQILNHDICVLGFRHKRIPLNALLTYLKAKEWSFSITQKPWSFQFSFTPLSCYKSDEMIKDLQSCVEHYTKNGFPTKEPIELAIYGSCAQVKDNGKKNMMLSMMLDTFIDLR